MSKINDAVELGPELRVTQLFSRFRHIRLRTRERGLRGGGGQHGALGDVGLFPALPAVVHHDDATGDRDQID